MADVSCQNPRRERHTIAPGDRKVTLTAVVEWGGGDLRDDWAKDYAFCSFACLAGWAGEKAGEHDGVFVRDGDSTNQSEVTEATV